MSGELLTDPSRATDTNNNSVSGATWTFYLTGTDTPQAVFADEGLTTSLGNVVTADANGQFVPIYLDSSIKYRGVRVSGDETIDIDPINTSLFSELASTDANKGSALVGFKADADTAVARTAETKMREFRTFEDFGAAGDAGTDGSGTDDTAAIQAAIDWCNGDGTRAIQMLDKNYLCGNIITYPFTCIIGSGRQTSAFICAAGTTGKWFTDGGNGAQKLWLEGIAWYGRNEAGLTHVAEFGNVGVQYGTEGMMRNLWFRDAGTGIALDVDANVGQLRDITLQGSGTGLKVLGNANQLHGIICIGNTDVGADISGAFVSQIELEGTGDGGLPLRINGNVHVNGILISNTAGRMFSHHIEVDETNYSDWQVCGLNTTPDAATVTTTNGFFKIGSDYYGGTDTRAVRGLDMVSQANFRSGNVQIKGKKWQSFTVRIWNDAGTIKHRIGSTWSSAIATNFSNRIVSATVGATSTPSGGGAFAGGASVASGGQFVFDTSETPVIADAMASASLGWNGANGFTSVRLQASAITINGASATRLYLQFFNGNSTAAVNNTTIANGEIVEVEVQGFF